MTPLGGSTFPVAFLRFLHFAGSSLRDDFSIEVTNRLVRPSNLGSLAARPVPYLIFLSEVREVSVSKFPGQPGLYCPQNHTHVWKRRLLYLEAKRVNPGERLLVLHITIVIDMVRQGIEK